ncbi:hypothetical protein Bca52824_037255 [Brassica carinata]|uniref:Peroxisomal ATPase PEX1 n=1 Tax=Brassica carinata TaxID=52824 RepID=A0A8X7S7G3_BRACI|nr:hypothetical protein Bca52824_037255 [Brassica carinata]
METEAVVRTVAGVDCFVSLPRQILHALQSTSSSLLPPLLPVELRSGDRHWPVAWSGSSSSSSAIEVARVFAESISLPDGTVVQVRVLSNVPKATLVTVEPETEDDWEVLELNAELAEAAILSQVRILHETMKFPLWLHDRTVIRFAVVSTFPPKGVVQLVPGTEVAVAPKRRERNLNAKKSPDASVKECSNVKVMLRVQETTRSAFHEADVKGFDVRVALTSIAYIHPETAEKYSLESLQMVSVSPRIPLRGNVKKDEALNIKTAKLQSSKKAPRRAIIRLVFSDLAAKGHLMMVESLRLYLGAGLHSWVHLRGCNVNVNKEVPALSLSPCIFKISEKENVLGRGTDLLGNPNSNRRSSHPPSGLTTNVDAVDWSVHEKVVTALLSEGLHIEEEQDSAYQLKNKKGLECLTRLWSLAQRDAIASVTGVDVSSLIVGRETLFHFEVGGLESYKSRDGQPSVVDRLEIRKKEKIVPLEILYVMTVSDESSLGDKFIAYELSLDRSEKKENLVHIDPVLEKMNLGEPIFFSSANERHCNKGVSPDISSLAWMGSVVSDVIKRMTVLLSPAAGMWFSKFNIPSPGHILIYGPPGSGKTILARAVAKYFEEKKTCWHMMLVSCSALALEKVQHIRQAISSVIAEGLEHAPSVIILDDLDSIISSSSDNEGTQASNAITMLTKFLTDVIDDYGEYRNSSCGIGPLAFVASVQSIEQIPQTLSSSECSEDILLELAAKCEGYDAYDLEILVDRAVHAAIGRHLPCETSVSKYTLVKEDFTRAMHEFVPVAMRDITKSASEGGRSGWEDVGGVTDVKNAIKEMIELPSRFPKIFAKSPLRLRSNVLLYGPPGCGKTHIVGAAAAACSLRFISVKGPELLNKYIGASEQSVRDIFAKAAAAAPCILFFDEFDSIAPKRGHDNTGVTDRVVNQFLTELDGVEVLTGVFVFAATSRPDLLDPALLRPGRLDRLLMCDFPSPPERLEILTVLSRKLPMADDIDLDPIAQMTEGFSGADLQALLSDAQLAAVHEFLSKEDRSEPGTTPMITDPLLKSIASKTKPSVSETEKQKLYDIYSQFLDSRKSSREAKGKRATLA